MTLNMKAIVLASALAGAATLASGPSSAMPLMGAQPAIALGSDLAPLVQDVRWVCGPYRCRWVPNRWMAPRPYWGQRRGWRRW